MVMGLGIGGTKAMARNGERLRLRSLRADCHQKTAGYVDLGVLFFCLQNGFP